MDWLTASRKARALWGPSAIARDGGAELAATAGEREQWRAELRRLEHDRPPEWRTRARALATRIATRRYTVGIAEEWLGFEIDTVRGEGCRRRSKFEPPCRPNIEPGVEADLERFGCG